MAGEIAELLSQRSGVSLPASLTTRVGTVTTESGTQVQVVVSDADNKVLLSVSVELREPQQNPKIPPNLTLTNRLHHRGVSLPESTSVQ